MNRTYAEEQADRNLELLGRWFDRARDIFHASESEVYEFARVAVGVYFHAEREQLPEILLTSSRTDRPLAHALWEAFGDPLWHNDEIVARRPDLVKADYLRRWLDRAITVAVRRAKYYGSTSLTVTQ